MMVQEKIGPLNCVRLDGGDSPSRLVVLCHGFGAPGDDLVMIGQYLLQMLGPSALEYRFLFPEAPISLESEGIPGGRAWWRLNMQRLMEMVQANSFDELRAEQPPGIEEAREMMVDTITQAAGQIEGENPLVIGGFSQGAMLTMDTALRGLQQPPAGLMQLSGTLICEAQWTERSERLGSIDVVQSHGTSDFVLPFVAAGWLREMLEAHARSFEFIRFDGQHAIPLEAIQGCASLLNKVAGQN